MTREELIKRLEELESEFSKEGLSPNEKEELLANIQHKEEQIETQKNELLEKEIQYEEFRSKYSDFYDRSPTCYLTLDDKGIIKEINLTATELLGIDKGKALDSPLIHYFVTDMLKFLEMLQLARQTFDQVSAEFIIKSSEKGNVNIYLTAVPYHEYKSRKIYFRVFFADITERKKSEKILKESEKRFRLMADASPALIWITDINCHLEYVNETKLKFIGKQFNEMSNRVWFETIHPEERGEFIKELNLATSEKRGFNFENRVLNSSGEYRWILDTAAPRFWEDGTFIGLIGSGVDVTKEKQSRLELERSLKEKEILLKEVHHRVKNNLQIISSLLNMQSVYIQNQELLSIIRSIQNRVRSMAFLHEKLYQSQNIEGVNSREYLNQIISHLFDTYNISSQIRLDLKIPDIYIEIGLSLSIGLIVNELVSNALKHAFRSRREGEILVELDLQQDKTLQLVVQDNGDGLPDDFDLEKNKSFGLELVDTLIGQHDGSIEINKNGNTAFKINLKYTEEDIIE